jgi:putative FmdB family regulatory protein
MPIYEYDCKNCGVVEVYRGIKDPPLKKCPKCGEKGLKRLISATGSPQFKGDGFYETDYKKAKS